jgi:large subunit ribosomal protein L10
MAVTKATKAEVLKDLNDKFSRAKAVYFSGYRGITVKKMVQLRKNLHKEGVDYAVAKKTLYKIAAKNNNFPEIPDEIMEGPVAAAFSYGDVVIPAKLLHEFSKEAEQLVILGGLVDGKVISKAEAKVLAMLPSRDQLLAKLVGSMKAPISGLHGVLSGTMRKLVYALAAVRDKKPAA